MYQKPKNPRPPLALNSLEGAINAAFSNPKQKEEMESDICKLVLKKIDAIPNNFLEYLKTFIENSRQGHDDEIHLFYRTERLPRLQEGGYEVFVPEKEIEIKGKKAIIPSAVIKLSHKRSHHKGFSFNKETWKNSKTPTFTPLPEGHISGENAHITDRYFCTVYSDFTATINIDGWDKTCKIIDKISDIPKRLIELVKKYSLNKNLSDKEIEELGSFKDMSLEGVIDILDKSVNSVHDFAVKKSIVHHYFGSALRILDEYYGLARSMPYVSMFEDPLILIMDSDSRVIKLGNIVPERNLTAIEIDKAIMHDMEKYPFNRRFHDRLRQKLANPMKVKEGYEEDAVNIITESYKLLQSGFYRSAIRQAATAFEVMLKGFVVMTGVKTQEEMDNMRYKTGNNDVGFNMSNVIGEYFDEAVAKLEDKPVQKDTFIPKLKYRISGFSNPRLVKSASSIKNELGHKGRLEGDHEIDIDVTKAVIDTYWEGIQYIAKEGWKQLVNLITTSDLLIGFSPSAEEIFFKIDESFALTIAESQFGYAKQYLEQIEIDRLKNVLPKDSWARKLL